MLLYESKKLKNSKITLRNFLIIDNKFEKLILNNKNLIKKLKSKKI
jgi:hypothetical protein